MSTMRWSAAVGLAVVSAGASLVAGMAIGERGASGSGRTVTEERREPAARRVRLPPGVEQHAGIRTARVERRTLSPTLELVGSVDFDADRVAEVGGRTAGRITRIFVRPGDAVEVGSALVEIESVALGEAAGEYVSARAHAAVARTNAEREAELARQHVTSVRDAEIARANAAALAADVRAAEQRLLAMGMGAGEIRSLGGGVRGGGRIVLRAPIAGRVVRRDAVLGQTVEPTNTVVKIADLTRLWVQLDVFEKDIARVGVGDRAEIRSEAHPGRVFRGAVNHVASTIDERTRTAEVRIEVDNPGAALRPGQFVTARVAARAGAREAVAVDRTAIVQIEGRPAVFVRVAPQEYELRSLGLGVSEGDAVEVLRGLSVGEELVVEGAFALKSELLR